MKHTHPLIASLLRIHRFKAYLAIATALALAASALAQKPKTAQTEEESRHAIASASIEQDPKFAAAVQRFQTGFGATIKLARADDAVFAKNYVATALKPEHFDNTLQILTWVESELKRYPAGFLKKHGPKNLVLANAYISKTAKGTTPAYSPTFIAEKSSDSILVTVPTTMTASIEVLGRGYLHQILFTTILANVKDADSPIGLAHWKTLESDDSKLDTETAKRLTKASNGREGLYKMLWDAWEFAELTKFAKTDAKLMQRIDLVKSYMTSLDPQFDAAYWTALAVIPEEQRVICLNDLSDTHRTDKIKADADIQADIKVLEKQWGFIVLWEPGSEAPPMPVKVRFEYSYFTDKKLHEFKTFIRMARVNLGMYPEQITKRLHIKNLYILDTFDFRRSGVAGQGMNWLPQPSLAYGLRTFDPAKPASIDFLRRTIHHEVLHLIDKEFSKEGGPIYGANWDSLNQEGFHYRIGSPGAAGNPSGLRFYKDNTKWQGFAEPYGMNIATDDRATLYARLMTAHVADEGRGDQPFLEKLKTDPILKAKADRLIAFFKSLSQELAIQTPNAWSSRLGGD
ncbi:MAG: hypothetical protein NTV80_00205 [Verrucomicrobia bacterium]|nr:hypothetical protein [Verrucomicrobiota bacterium]